MGWTTGVACVAAVALTACAHDADGALPEAPTPAEAEADDEREGGDRRADYVDAQAAALSDATFDGLDLATARCIAGAIVDVATVDALEAADVTPDELADMQSLVDLDLELAGGPPGAVSDLTVAFGACDLATELAPLLVTSLGSGLGADIADDDRDCVVDALGDEEFRAALADTVVEGTARMADEVVMAVGRCPGALAELAAVFFIGDAAREAGEGRACLEERLADEPTAARTIFEAGDAAEALLAELAEACDLELVSDGPTPTTPGAPGDDPGDAGPGEPGQVGGGWDPDLGFGTDDPATEAVIDGRTPPDPAPPPAGTPPDAVEISRLIAGSGPGAATGDELVVHYVGVLPDGRVLDSSYEMGQPLVIPALGDGMLIPGWEEGLVGAQAGERRRLVVGSAMAYGPEGSDDVPPDTPLAFEIDVLEVTPG